VEHWFDALARPHSRATTLKAGALGLGAALAGPLFRPQLARATEQEPCFGPCVKAAADRWGTALDACFTANKANTVVTAGKLVTDPFFVGVLLAALQTTNDLGCRGAAELSWHRNSIACRGSECGNGAKYPGGTVPPPPKPAPKCDPVQEKVCGDICCYVTTDCCLKNGAYLCYAVGHNCGNP
jgi:hypothetical protein